MDPLKILFLTAEVAPFAKTGGLGDVSAALPRYLARAGHDVRVVMPLYDRVRRSGAELETVIPPGEITLALGPHRVRYGIARAPLPDSEAHVHFVDCPALYAREGIYTNDGDEHLRFAALGRAALELAQRWGFAPDVVHLNDWHTALVPIELRTVFGWDRLFEHTKTLFTIHNLGHQGVFGSNVIADLGLGGGEDLLPRDDVAAGHVNFMKTGILRANRLSTVSPTYAREIQTEEHGFGLHDLLRARRADLVGILNGIDTSVWDPKTDAYAPHFSDKSLHRKELAKKALLSSVGLPYEKDVPVFGIVTRLSKQKGIELLYEPIPHLLATRDVRFVALGSGAPDYEAFLQGVQDRFPGKACYWRGFNDPLAHLIEAGSDFFLMPSLYEPCGLNQMYSLRYGTVPIVRKTGGLADTVEPFRASSGEGTGFVFEHSTAQGLRWAIGQALEAYADKKAWRQLQKNGMAKDFSWDASGARYVALYESMLPKGAHA